MSMKEESQLLDRLPTLDLLYQNALDQSKFILPPCMYFNALFFTTASAIGMKDIKIHRQTNRGTKIIIPNFYAISFSKSGAGKDHSLKLAKRYYEQIFNKFELIAEQFYDARNQDPRQPDRRYVRLSDYFIDVTSSEQGIQKAAQTISDMEVGSVEKYYIY